MPEALLLNNAALKGEKPAAQAPQLGVSARPLAPVARESPVSLQADAHLAEVRD